MARPEARPLEFGTAGGSVRNYVIPSAPEVSVLGGGTAGLVTGGAVISHIEPEVLVNE